MVQMHEKRCIDYMINLCRELKLIIESNHVPKKRVRAGEEPEQSAAETSEQATAEESIHESSTVLDFPLRWRTCEAYGDTFLIFRPPPESADLDHVAHQEASDQFQAGLEVLHDQPRATYQVRSGRHRSSKGSSKSSSGSWSRPPKWSAN